MLQVGTGHSMLPLTILFTSHYFLSAAVQLELQLANGPHSCAGRVQIYHGNDWHTVCYDGWGMEEAEVVCRYLGCGSAVSTQWTTQYGEETGSIMLDDVNCAGSELSLKQCPSSGWKLHNCASWQVAGVHCEVELRLVNGPHSCAGRVQIYHGNDWHTVCYDGWGMEEAEVVCRYLGCGSAVSTQWTTQYGEGTGSIMLDDVNCAGSELSLKQCPSSGWKLHNCASWQVAGVHCEVGLRLVNGPHSCAGRVEIYHDNEWGTVCGDHWGMKEAEVVCRELGCGNVIKASGRGQYGEGTGPIMLDNVNCTGSESSLKQCPSNGWKVHNCDHRKDAGVQCRVALRLVNGPHACAGRVEIYYGNEWGTVCDYNWGMEEAAVVCRELGCGDPVSAQEGAHYGQGTGPVWLDNVSCKGSESSLKQCPSMGWKKQNCQHSEDAGVQCKLAMRLTNGPNPCTGRVEIYHDNEWGTVCDDNWGMEEAAVVCRQLGCGDAVSAPGIAHYGQGTGPKILNDVTCVGSESSLKQCSSMGWKNQICGHGKDAGVHCKVVIRLVNGPHPCAGRVEIYHDNEWGTVCDDNWGMEEATVVCRELGCGDAVSAPRAAHYGRGTGPIMLADLNCEGSESSLQQCSNMGWKNQICGHWKDAGVDCKEQVEEPEIRMNENETEIVCASKNSSYNYRMCVLYQDGQQIQDTIVKDVDHASFNITDLPAGSSFSCLCYEHNLTRWTRNSSVITKGTKHAGFAVKNIT
ncbi:deleted in malignant brain tumors 1 protein-like [Protopterus annectens]|uniref:deleted in malignant brain tumors 1 protein-like n=1 Tax=Protopterus annectens TaxID=7888 RepID=UPI001CFA7E6B|nr:deleted in malignant brain tumors 1 protein-like [Protopterus annectens]